MGDKSEKNKLDWLEIWVDFKSGDRRAFEIIYSTFVDRLYAYGAKMTTDKDVVKDAIQDLFIGLYNYSIDLKKPESLEFYLVKSLNRIIVSSLNRSKKLGKISEAGQYTFDLRFDFEEDFLRKETISLQEESIKQILQELEPQKRELLFLKFHTGLNNSEIAKVLNIKEETVKKQLYRLLRQLRKQYGSRLIYWVFKKKVF